MFPGPKLGDPVYWAGMGRVGSMFEGPSFFEIGDTTIHHPRNQDFPTGLPPGRFIDGCFIPNDPNKPLTEVKRVQHNFKDLKFDLAKSGISSSFPERPIDVCPFADANKMTGSSREAPTFSDFPTGLSPGRFINGIFFPYYDKDSPFIPFIPYEALQTGVKRFSTANNDMESDKSENVESYPKRPKHVGSSAAANKKADGNVDDSYDKSSKQATQGASDPYNRSIFVDNNLGANNITDVHLRQKLAPFGELLYVLITEKTQCGFAMFTTRRSAEEAIRNLNGTDLAGQKLRLSFASNDAICEAISAETKAALSRWSSADPPVSDRVPPPSPGRWLNTVETGDTRIQTTVKDLEWVNSENVDRCPQKTGGNGQGSYDESSNQATQSDIGPNAASYKSVQASHGGMDPKIPNNTSILVDNLVPNVTEEQLRQFFTPCGEVNYVKIMAGTRFGFVQFVNRSSAEEAIRSMNGKELAGQNLKLTFSNKKERGEEYKDNDLPYGWSGSGIFRGLPPLCSDSGLPIGGGGWFTAPSPFILEKVLNPADPRMAPTKQDVQTDDAIMDLYMRWCGLNNVCRTPDEMIHRFRFFKKEAIAVYKRNRDNPDTSFGLMHWADDPSKKPRGGVII